MQTICLFLHSQKHSVLVSRLLNNSPMLPLFSQMFRVQWWGKKRNGLNTEPATNGNSWGSQSFQHFFSQMTVQSILCRKVKLILARKSYALWVRHRRTLYVGAFGKETEGLVWLSRATETNSVTKICWFVWSCSLNDREGFRIEAPSYCFTVLQCSLLSHLCNWEREDPMAPGKFCACVSGQWDMFCTILSAKFSMWHHLLSSVDLPPQSTVLGK